MTHYCKVSKQARILPRSETIIMTVRALNYLFPHHYILESCVQRTRGPKFVSENFSTCHWIPPYISLGWFPSNEPLLSHSTRVKTLNRFTGKKKLNVVCDKAKNVTITRSFLSKCKQQNLAGKLQCHPPTGQWDG